jgi:DnaJ-class molecular chaperone
MATARKGSEMQNVKCPYCKGTGIESEDDMLIGAEGMVHVSACPYCEGMGYVVRCSLCQVGPDGTDAYHWMMCPIHGRVLGWVKWEK